jgi:cytochrome c-type biogenesis protein CcmH/NrfG
VPLARTPDPTIPALEGAARLLGLGMIEAAETELRRVLAAAPSDVRAWFLLGEVLERRGERAQAHAAFSAVGRHARGAEDEALVGAANRNARRLGASVSE